MTGDPHATPRAIAESLLGFASERIAAGAEITPMWIIVDRDGASTVAMTPWCDEADKGAMLAALAEQMRSIGAVRYGMVSEAWMLVRRPGDPVVEPRLSDRRIEVVTICAADIDGAKLHCTAKIIRSPDTSPRLDEASWLEGDQVQGRMADLLNQNPTARSLHGD